MANQWWRKLGRAVLHGEGIYGFLTSDLVRAFVWPALVSAMTFLAGLFSANPVPLPYLLTATALTFAAVATGLARIDAWRKSRYAGGKLLLSDPFVIPYGDQTQDGYCLQTVAVGFNLQNHADFPMYFHVSEIRTVFDNKVNMSPKYQARRGHLKPFTSTRFFDDQIGVYMAETASNPQFMARLECTVEYGKHPEQLRFRETIIYDIAALFDWDTKQFAYFSRPIDPAFPTPA